MIASDGTPLISNCFAVEDFISGNTVYSIPTFFTNDPTFTGFIFSRLTPRTTTPLSPNSFFIALSSGNASLQAWHHVAQKSITTTLPLNEDNVTLVPLR